MRNLVENISRLDNFVLLFVVIFLSCVGQCFAVDNSSQIGTAPAKADLVVSWPGHPSWEITAVTFKVPREYLHQSTTWVEDDGSIESFAVEFELPGPTPVQSRPWLKGKKGTPEYEKFMETWQGRFSMDVGRYISGGKLLRDSLRRKAQSSSVLFRDVGLAGLDRYSSLVCYDAAYLKSSERARDFLAGKESDDFSPENCRLDRRWVSLFSPQEVTSDEEGVAIRCMSTGCKAYFSAAGRGVGMGMSHKDIDNWSRIVEPARTLVRSFVVKGREK